MKLMPRDHYPSKLAYWAARHDWLKWFILFAASFSAVLEVIDTSIVNVAIPDMQGNLGASLSEIGWVSTGYAMANVVIIPLTAWMGDRFGKKRYFLFSLVAFTLASIACGMSTNLTMLIISRVIQGLGGGGLLAKGQSILFETFPPEEHAKASAVFGLGVIVGPTLGPSMGGWLTDTVGWRWIFFINIPFGIFAVWMISTFLFNDDDAHRAKKASQSVDWFGIILLAVGLGCFQVVLEQGQQEDWFSSHFIQRCAIASAVGLVLFVWQELHTEHPAVDLRVLRYPALAAGSLYSVVVGIVLYGTVFVIPVFAQNILHFTATKTGLILIPGALASACGMIIMGRFLKYFDPRYVVVFGSLVTLGAVYNLSSLNPDTGSDQLFYPLLARGFGMVFMFIPLTIATLGGLPKKDVPSGAGFFSLTRQLGGSIGIAIMTTLVDKMQVVHRSELVYKITDYDTSYAERLSSATGFFATNTGDPVQAHLQALFSIDRAVNLQAALLSFIDVFVIVSIMIVLSLFLIPLLGRGGNTTDLEETAAH